MKNIIICLAVLNISLSLDQIISIHENKTPRVVNTYKVSGDKLVLQKETEFADNGDKVAEYVYSNGGLTSSTKWDENRKKKIIRYKYKWTHEELDMYYAYVCQGNDSSYSCKCLRDIVLNELSYMDFLTAMTLTQGGPGPNIDALPRNLREKVERIMSLDEELCRDFPVTNTKDVEIAMKNMYQSAGSYYNRFGSMPVDCYEELLYVGMIEIEQNVIDSWDFQCDWEYDDWHHETIGTITATSTDSNEAGPGKVLVLDILNNEYTGYGQGQVDDE